MAVEAVSSAGDEPLPTCSPDLALSHLNNKNKHTARLYCRYSRLKHTGTQDSNTQLDTTAGTQDSYTQLDTTAGTQDSNTQLDTTAGTQDSKVIQLSEP